jgi:hypothetical protein
MLATIYGLGLAGRQVTMLTAELHLHQGLLGEAQTAAEEVLHLGTGGKQGWEMALAHRLMGQCARTRGLPPSAEEHLRAALVLFVEMGADLEAARTRAALAEVLMAGPDPRNSLDEAHRLVAEARAAFVACGAVWDARQAEGLASAWGLSSVDEPPGQGLATGCGL